MNEIWKDIPKYPHCEVSNQGRVRYKKEPLSLIGRKLKRYRPIKLAGFGYYQVSINGKTESIHNLVAEAFIGPRPDSSYRCHHIDEDKLNNSPNNLQWLVHGHNTIRPPNTGGRRYFYRGELWLMKKLIGNKVPYKTIGKMFKCSTMLIQDVKRGLKNNHIKLL